MDSKLVAIIKLPELAMMLFGLLIIPNRDIRGILNMLTISKQWYAVIKRAVFDLRPILTELLIDIHPVNKYKRIYFPTEYIVPYLTWADSTKQIVDDLQITLETHTYQLVELCVSNIEYQCMRLINLAQDYDDYTDIIIRLYFAIYNFDILKVLHNKQQFICNGGYQSQYRLSEIINIISTKLINKWTHPLIDNEIQTLACLLDSFTTLIFDMHSHY